MAMYGIPNWDATYYRSLNTPFRFSVCIYVYSSEEAVGSLNFLNSTLSSCVSELIPVRFSQSTLVI